MTTPGRLYQPLGDRELQMVRLMCEFGSDLKTIAAVMGIKMTTARSMRYRIATKLGAVKSGQMGAGSSSCLMVANAFRSGLLNDVPPFAAPSPEYARERAANPYVIRYGRAGTDIETVSYWLTRRPMHEETDSE
jgi:hypothetical protein